MSESESAQSIRERSMRAGLRREDLDPDPYRQFERWFGEAMGSGIAEPNAMSLATVDGDGQPWLRTVLLKTYDRRGFVFFTNYNSRKARHIEHNPRVALLFPWVALARQVHITGTATRVPTAESVAYFATRPRGSQLSAWASAQSSIVSDRDFLEDRVKEMSRRFRQGRIPLPEFWGGYRVTPIAIEFWQGRDNRLHDRFQYRAEGGGWVIERLAP